MPYVIDAANKISDLQLKAVTEGRTQSSNSSGPPLNSSTMRRAHQSRSRSWSSPSNL